MLSCWRSTLTLPTQPWASQAATVTGTIYDKSGATVPNAKVELQDVGTKAKTSVTTGSDGGYIFPSVKPGNNYSIAVFAKGFRQTVVNGVRVEIGKSALVNAVLEIGGVTETVEVTAGTGVELQTLDSSVGNVLDANMLSNLPNINRDATSLSGFQRTRRYGRVQLKWRNDCRSANGPEHFHARRRRRHQQYGGRRRV